MSAAEEQVVQRICGGNSATKRAVFSLNSKFLLVACGRKVLVYSAQTGKLVVEVLHHSDDVTGIVIDKQDHNQVFTASLDGRIALWNYQNGELLKALNVDRPILSLCTRHDTVQPSLYISVKNYDNKVVVYAINSSLLTDETTANDGGQSVVDMYNDKPVLNLGKKSNEFSFTYDSKYLVSSKKKSLILHDVFSNTTSRIFAQSVICSLACHPCQLCVAAGTISGNIFLWYNFEPMSNVVTRQLHWHAHAVTDICFSTDGTFLLSGGEEAVLVLWQLANDQKHFRPRLGAPIMGVACCYGDQTFAVSLKSNAIQLVSGFDNKVNHTLVQLYRALPGLNNKISKAPPTGLVHDPRSHSIVLNGCPGKLQFFDADKMAVKYQLEVACLNFISRQDRTSLVPTIVSHIAFSSCGLKLATLEEWNNEMITPERRLKFWKFNPEIQTYTTTTCIESPHQFKITDLLFKPSTREHGAQSQLDVVVSTSVDGSFKVWTYRKDGANPNTPWVCRSEGKYYPSLPCKGGAFSEDGSLLALNYDKYITVWEPLTCSHRYSFNSISPDDHFKRVTFGCHSSSHLLFAASDTLFHIWDLLTCECVLTTPLSVDVLVADPYSSQVAIFASSKLYKFSPSDSTPTVIELADVMLPITSAMFLPVREEGHTLSSQLYFMDTEQVLFSLIRPVNTGKDQYIDEVLSDEEDASYREVFGNDNKQKLFSKEMIKVSSANQQTSTTKKYMGESTDSEDDDQIVVSCSDGEVIQDDNSYGGKFDGSMIDDEETIDNIPTKEKQLRKATTVNYNWLVDFLKEEL